MHACPFRIPDGLNTTASVGADVRLDYAPFLAVAFADVLNIDSTRCQPEAWCVRRVVFFSQKTLAAWDGEPKKKRLERDQKVSSGIHLHRGVVCQVSLCPKHP